MGERQAWENLKKVMEIVRRAENRGYLTMSRLADFLASAATDDESRAVLEAVDAVNLMTIHSAKEPNRVEEEEKRLLYVALTRARRRLGLSAVSPEAGEPERSFLGLLPRSFRDRFREALDAQGDVDNIEWRGHALRILRPAAGRKFHRQAPERRDRLRVEPLSPDAYEASVEARGEDLAPREDIPVPPPSSSGRERFTAGSPSRSREEAPSFAGSSIFSWSRPTKLSSSDSMDRRAQNIGIRWRSVSKRWKRARPARW